MEKSMIEKLSESDDLLSQAKKVVKNDPAKSLMLLQKATESICKELDTIHDELDKIQKIGKL